MPRRKVVARRVLEESVSWTPPMRSPGARGANKTVTVQEFPAVIVPVQVVPFRVKSRPGAPCVTTVGFELNVVFTVTL
jgi:hypothetical protein